MAKTSSFRVIELPESHFAFNSIKNMLSKQIEKRPNLREIILLLTCLQKAIQINPDLSIDEVFMKLNKVMLTKIL